MVGKALSVREVESVSSLTTGFGLGNLSSLSLADRSFLSWSDDPDLELASDESLWSVGVSIHRRRLVCEGRDGPFLGSLRELVRAGTSGGWERRPNGSVSLLPKVLGGNGGGQLCKKGSVWVTPPVSSCSEKGPARSSELFHSELLVFAK